MPSNPILTQPDAVMPIGLMIAFSEVIERPALADGPFSGGETIRFPLTMNPRRMFRLARRLSQVDADALRNFLLQHKCRPFWFYNIRETAPVGSWDPTGQNPVGRYPVVWAGAYEQESNLPGVAPGRGDSVSIELREVGI